MKITTPDAGEDGTHLMVPPVNSTLGSTTFPFSAALVMSKTASIIAHAINTEDWAK